MRRWRFPPKRNACAGSLSCHEDNSLCFDRSSLRRDYQHSTPPRGPAQQKLYSIQLSTTFSVATSGPPTLREGCLLSFHRCIFVMNDARLSGVK